MLDFFFVIYSITFSLNKLISPAFMSTWTRPISPTLPYSVGNS